MNPLKSIVIFCALLVSFTTKANEDKYFELMQKNITALYAAKDQAQLQEVVNSLERIAGVEKTKWEPLYYISYGYVMMANGAEGGAQKDVYLDKAMTAIESAKKLSSSESEIVAMEGFIYMLRIGIDPQSRGAMYAPRATQSFNTAVALNPENPRALGLLAQMQFGSAQFFGSPVTDACALNTKAGDKMKTYKSDNKLAPTWGSQMIEGLAKMCK